MQADLKLRIVSILEMPIFNEIWLLSVLVSNTVAKSTSQGVTEQGFEVYIHSY
jgi:hypothetical protein